MEDGQTVFQALSQLPFKYVYELIGRMNHVTNETDPIIKNGVVCYGYALTKKETDLIFQALGLLPYQSVHQVIHNLKEDINAHDTPA